MNRDRKASSQVRKIIEERLADGGYRTIPNVFQSHDTPNRNVLHIADGEMSEERIGEEVRRFSNQSAKASSTESFNVSKRTAIVVELGIESAIGARGGLSLGFPSLGELKASVETLIRSRYSLQSTSDLTHSQTSTFELPPLSAVEIGVEWKRVWQHGTVTVEFPVGSQARTDRISFPYRATVALRYNTVVRDI